MSRHISFVLIGLLFLAANATAAEPIAPDFMPKEYPPVLRYLTTLKQIDAAWEEVKEGYSFLIQAGKAPLETQLAAIQATMPFDLKYSAAVRSIDREWFQWYGVGCPAAGDEARLAKIEEVERAQLMLGRIVELQLQSGKGPSIALHSVEASRLSTRIALWQMDGRAKRFPEAYRGLLKERLAACREALSAADVAWRSGKTPRFYEVLPWTIRAAFAELDLTVNREERVAIRRRMVAAAREIEWFGEPEMRRQNPPPADPMPRAERLAHEIALRLEEGNDPAAPGIRTLRKERRDLLRQNWHEKFERTLRGVDPLSASLDFRRQLLHADLELLDDAQERAALFETALRDCRLFELAAKLNLEAGKATITAVAHVRALRLEVEAHSLAEELAQPPEQFDRRLRQRLSDVEREAFWKAVKAKTALPPK